MMKEVKALTELEPIDGFRFNINTQPLNVLRTSGTWNYAIANSQRYFDACVTLFNSSQNENNFLTVEMSGLRGITAIGSYNVLPEYGVLVKGEGYIKKLKEHKKGNYMVEIRKILGPAHIGIFMKNKSFGLNTLHRVSPFTSYGYQLELTVSFPLMDRMILINSKVKQDAFMKIISIR